MDFRKQLDQARQVQARDLKRRWFFQECGVGLAGIAATNLLARDGWAADRRASPERSHDGRCGESAGAQGSSFPRESQTCDLHVPRRSAQPAGTVRPQAGTGETRWPVAAGRTVERLSGGVHRSQLGAARSEVQVRSARPMWHAVERAAAAHGKDRRRHLSGAIAPHRSGQSRAGPDHDEHGIAAIWASQFWILGVLWFGK